MPLYSTDILSKAMNSDNYNESKSLGAEVKECAINEDKDERLSWCYLFVHHTRVNFISESLKQQFNVFIHTSTVYRKEKGHIVKHERPTISGLIFIQGENHRIQAFLDKNHPGLHLVNDCSTKKAAIIPDEIMRPFIQISILSPHRIRFMPHSYGYYSAGHTLIKVTSGILSGFEGYLVRISRDKCLVTSIGGMTVAISGICKESFENVEEYIRQKKESIGSTTHTVNAKKLNPIQTKINSCFFRPCNQIDLVMISKSISQWIQRAQDAMSIQNYDEATKILLAILEAMGTYFQNISHIGSFKEINELCLKSDELLTYIIMNMPNDQIKYHVNAERQALITRYPFLSIK